MISYDTPICFELGVDGLPYAVLPNEFEAEDYANFALKDTTLPFACCDGFLNGVLLQRTIGM